MILPPQAAVDDLHVDMGRSVAVPAALRLGSRLIVQFPLVGLRVALRARERILLRGLDVAVAPEGVDLLPARVPAHKAEPELMLFRFVLHGVFSLLG